MKNIFLFLVLVSIAGCAHTSKNSAGPKPENTLVFIQGVHLDGSSWNDVKNRIPVDEFNVLDLDRMGRDVNRSAGDIASLKGIAALGCQTIPEKSILVGHSFGGAISNAMFGICPDKIIKIIYVTAVVPLNGELPYDRFSKKDSLEYGKAVDFTDSMIIPKEPKIFFGITDQQVDLNATLPNLTPESLNLMKDKLVFDANRFKALPKTYLFTVKDKVVSLKTQRNYVRAAKITQTNDIPTGHFPMLSNPTLLSELILKWAKN